MTAPRLSHRTAPTPVMLGGRRRRLAAQRQSILSEPQGNLPPQLERGNSKTGSSGGRFRSVWVWNLPAAATCPGASDWCLGTCYNGDERPDVYNFGQWSENWSWAIHEPDRLAKSIRAQLASAPAPSAVRIHSSGDFYSEEYVNFWMAIVRATPSTVYWAYTRSWAVDHLRGSLENLRSMANLQLFASWDATMPDPPDGWRLSWVKSSDSAKPPSLLRCPEETHANTTCATCEHCLKPHSRGVWFSLH